jgi:hypothetical protein
MVGIEPLVLTNIGDLILVQIFVRVAEMQKQPISEQARLAMSLVDSLGREGAIHACRANGWQGVLDCLLGADYDAPDEPEQSLPRNGPHRA